MDEPSAIIAFVTAPAFDKASEIAHTLVAGKLAACATIIPRVKSIYWWEGKICQDEEALILVKTEKALFPDVMNRIKSIHNYEVPEIISVSVTGGLPAYLEWIKSTTTQTP